MSDDTPREPFRETPAPDDGEPRMPYGAPDYGMPGPGPGYDASAESDATEPGGPPYFAPPVGSTWGGVRALLLIIGGMIVVELMLYAAAKLLDGPRWAESFNSSQAVVWLAGGMATIVVTAKLPPKSRTGFLASCGILIGTVFTLMIVMCGIALMNM